MEEKQAYPPPGEHAGDLQFPELPTGREFRKHTRRSILNSRSDEFHRMDNLLDGYKASLDEYCELCRVRYRGFVALRKLRDAYFIQLPMWNFQRRYCLERAHWERGLNLEQQALARLQSEACNDLIQVQAGKHGIANLRPAQTVLSDIVTAGERLAPAGRDGQPLVSLEEMQQKLMKTEQLIGHMRDNLVSKRVELRLQAQHVKRQFSLTAAKLAAVCTCFHQLRGAHFDNLVRRNRDGFLSKLQQSIRNAEAMIAGCGSGG